MSAARDYYDMEIIIRGGCTYCKGSGNVKVNRRGKHVTEVCARCDYGAASVAVTPKTITELAKQFGLIDPKEVGE